MHGPGTECPRSKLYHQEVGQESARHVVGKCKCQSSSENHAGKLAREPQPSSGGWRTEWRQNQGSPSISCAMNYLLSETSIKRLFINKVNVLGKWRFYCFISGWKKFKFLKLLLADPVITVGVISSDRTKSIDRRWKSTSFGTKKQKIPHFFHFFKIG